ncbi:MAG TPA: Re/Si-specific NAD(P)(+) transhydrogenase subunit alpha, partial [Thermoleophilia bacterium]|nr:Re/Si-specific NAD(P)(+) transhydrogenase subunit alpha [Thermoleophilia bacterium]
MKVGVPRERAAGERRVALTPDTVSRLVGAGRTVLVERGAGDAASLPDDDYREAGAEVVEGEDLRTSADVLVRVGRIEQDDLAGIRPGTVLIGYIWPLTSPDLVSALAAAGITAFGMESVPRVTRAQRMDSLSSQSTVAGYKAVVIAAEQLPRFFPMLMTAAGTVAPARVLVLGAGVAGLQAIATGRRLGAVVSSYDTRPVVKEQVESLGATFIELDLGDAGGQDARGYATALSDEQQQRQREQMAAHIAASDVVITTALVPGRPAPKLIPATAVERMRPGSVIVDLAAETGGNCELTRPGEVVELGGVTLVGLLNLPSAMPAHASQLYARNVSALLEHLAPGGELTLDWEDEIT